jgi:hypothetical protein
MPEKPRDVVILTEGCFARKESRPPQLEPSCAVMPHIGMQSATLKVCALLVLGIFPWILVSCATTGSTRQPQRADRVLYRWYDDGGPGKVSIHISLPDQIAEFERDGRQIGWCYVATGREGFGTKPGNYRITEKIVDKYSNRYGWIEDEFGNVVIPDARYNDQVPEGMVYVPAPMPYWMRLTSYGIGMHGGVIPEPGMPASHGCIRLPKRFVPVLYDSVEVGTPVTISMASATQGPRALPLQPPQYEDVYPPMDQRSMPVARPSNRLQGY